MHARESVRLCVYLRVFYTHRLSSRDDSFCVLARRIHRLTRNISKRCAAERSTLMLAGLLLWMTAIHIWVGTILHVRQGWRTYKDYQLK